MAAASRTRSSVALLLIVGTIGFALARGFNADNAGQLGFLLWTSVPTLLVAVIAIVRAIPRGDVARWLRPEWGDITRGFLAGLLLFVCAFVFVKITIPPASPHEAWMARIYLALGDTGRLRDHMALVAVGIVIASAAEEIVWRGLVIELASDIVGTRWSWVLGGLAYGAAHAGTVLALADDKAGPNPMLLFAALGCGLVWSFMRRSFGRLPPAIVAHALFDWTVVMMFRLWGPSV
jgi:membrane protease YdiL (CAAX protease family)